VVVRRIDGEVFSVTGEVDFEFSRGVLGLGVAKDEDGLALAGSRREGGTARGGGVGGRESDEDVALDGRGEDGKSTVIDVLAYGRKESARTPRKSGRREGSAPMMFTRPGALETF
jgi:hypothetical protein